ncbi:MAG: GyrI-like domain-containing protein [Bacteroidia bacterium]|nr:GyrI-like domain-containing protein [Bacteroidia bacterium]MCF8425737.1 GyrI-like domain-containing protein [Bacteroidia bacterium]MCF8446391.1 GyrI-like domain-containing protein [Bacteroidia bacterium]
MKTFKITLIAILSLLILLVIVSLFLPNKVHVERSIEINGKPKQAFKLVNQLKEWSKWDPWHQLDSNTVWTYSEVEQGVGASYSWKSNNPNVGEGSLSIIEAIPDSMVKSEMKFGGMGISIATFYFEPTESGSKVTWAMDSEEKGMPIWMIPMSRYFKLFMDKMIGPEFEKGLVNLKNQVEADKPILIEEFEAEVREASQLNYIGIREKIKGDEIGEKLNAFYQALNQEIVAKNLQKVGVPFTINYAANGDVFDMKAAIAITQESNETFVEPIQFGKVASGKWLVVNFYGKYDDMGRIYHKGFEYLNENNLKPTGAPMEFYITDITTESDTSKWLTELAFPFMD